MSVTVCADTCSGGFALGIHREMWVCVFINDIDNRGGSRGWVVALSHDYVLSMRAIHVSNANTFSRRCDLSDIEYSNRQPISSAVWPTDYVVVIELPFERDLDTAPARVSGQGGRSLADHIEVVLVGRVSVPTVVRCRVARCELGEGVCVRRGYTGTVCVCQSGGMSVCGKGGHGGTGIVYSRDK